MKAIYQLFGKLPLSVLYLLSKFGYVLVYYLIRYRRDIVNDNLLHAFPEKSVSERLDIEKNYYRFICDNFVEVIHSPTMTKQQLLDRIEFTNLDVIQPYIDAKQSMQFLSIHQGNWEWVLQILSSKLDVPLDAIYKPLHSPSFEAFLFKNRSRFGSHLIPSKNAIKELLRKRREFRAFIMTAEQAPIRRDKKYWQLFFNRPSSFYLGPQKIAELTKYPVFYLQVHRHKQGHYQLSFELIAEPPFEKNSFKVLDAYITCIEKSIRAQPETWLWSNRKWRKKPVLDENSYFAKDFPMEIIKAKPQ